MPTVGRYPARALVTVALLMAASLNGQVRSERLQKADALADQGSIPEAEKAYRAILNGPDPGPDIPHAALKLARLLAGGPTSDQEEAAQWYARAGQQGDARLQIEAKNGMGVLRLRQGRAPEAVDLLASVEEQIRHSNEFNTTARSRYLYNYATALEKSGSPEKAGARFLEALELDSSFQPARDGAERVADASPPKRRVQKMAELCRVLIRKGELSAAREYLLRALRNSQDLSGAPYDDLLVLLVRYWTAAKVAPDEAWRDWLPLLRQSTSWMSPASLGRAKGIEQAYTEKRPPIFDRFIASEQIGPWGSPKDAAQAFSGFLKMLGDVFLEKGDAQMAVSRYALAFSATGNLDAGVYLAGLLSNEHLRVDPDGRVLNEFMGGIFSAKGEAYLLDDWPNILRLHTLLGTIFERQRRWGTSRDPYGAIFQWEHAVEALEKVPGRGLGDAPALHAHLAAAYVGGNRGKEALQQYLIAAEQYVAGKRPEAAETQLLRVDALDAVADPAERQRASAVRAMIEPRRPPPAGMPGQQNLMKISIAAATPGEGHTKLEPFVGSFTVKTKTWIDSLKPPEETEGTSEKRWVLSGRFIEERVEGTAMGQPFSGIGYTGYDNYKKKYVCSWADSMGTMIVTSTGTADASGKKFTFWSTTDDVMMKKIIKIKSQATIVDDDHLTYEVWGPGPDGKTFKWLEVQYTRKK